MSASPRRRTDEEEADFIAVRGGGGGGPFNGQTKWVVGVVSTGIVSAMAFLLVQDRNGFDRRLSAVEQLALETRQVQVGVVIKLDVKVEELQRSLVRIEAELAEIKRRGR